MQGLGEGSGIVWGFDSEKAPGEFFFSLFVCLFEFGIYFLNWDYMLFFLFFFLGKENLVVI